MTRTTDDLSPDKFQPLGSPIRKEPEKPKPQEISPGVFRAPDGKLYTDTPLPKEKS